MRFLANENFPGDAVAALRTAGQDVAWVRTDAPGCADKRVLECAVAGVQFTPGLDTDLCHLQR